MESPSCPYAPDPTRGPQRLGPQPRRRRRGWRRSVVRRRSTPRPRGCPRARPSRPSRRGRIPRDYSANPRVHSRRFFPRRRSRRRRIRFPRGRGARLAEILLRDPRALRFHRVVRSRDRHDVQEHRDQVVPVRDDVLGPAHALFRVETRVGRVRHLREDDEGVTAELADHLARRGETRPGVTVVRMLFGPRVDVRGLRVDGRAR